MGGSFGHMWLKLYAWTQIKQPVSTKTSYYIFYYFWKDPKFPLAAESKSVIVLGITLLVLGFCGWLLWSYVVETLCLDTNQTGCVDVDFALEVLVLFQGTTNTL